MADTVESQAFQMKVLETLKANRFQDSLRSVMRLKMIEKMQGQSFGTKKKRNMDLKEKLGFSLFYNFLEAKEMQMTQSILLPELGIETGLLSDMEIVEIIKQNDPTLNKYLSLTTNPESLTLLEFIIQNYLQRKKEVYSSSTQTISSSNDLDLDTKLSLIEQNHRYNSSKENNSQAYERLLLDMQQRYKKDLENEVKRIREVELGLCKSQESSKWQTRFEKYRDELEAAFNTRLASLKDRETELMTTYTEKVKDLEAKLWDQKEKHNIENDFKKRELEYDNKINQFDKSCLEKRLKDLERKEREVLKKQKELDHLEQLYEEKLQQQMEIYKTVTLKDIREKKILLESKLKKLNEELDKITGMKGRMTELSERNKNLELKLGTSEDERRQLDDKSKAIQRELENLRDTLSLQNQGFLRSEAAVERLNLQLQAKVQEVDHIKVLNQQLRDLVEMNRKETILMQDNRANEEMRLRRKIEQMENYIFSQDQNKISDYLKMTDTKYDTKFSEAQQQAQKSRGEDVLARLDEETKALKSRKNKILEYLDKDQELKFEDFKQSEDENHGNTHLGNLDRGDNKMSTDEVMEGLEEKSKSSIQHATIPKKVKADENQRKITTTNTISSHISNNIPKATNSKKSSGFGKLGGLPDLPGLTKQKTQTQKKSESDGFGDIDGDFDLDGDDGFDWEKKDTPTNNAVDKSKSIIEDIKNNFDEDDDFGDIDFDDF